jgi:hypothetical protein
MTLPKENGGLNIIDIRLQNQCLLLKWLWVAIKEPDLLWGSSLPNLGITFTINENAINHHNNSSQFIRDLNNLLPLLRASLTTDTQAALVWNTKWTPNHLFSKQPSTPSLSISHDRPTRNLGMEVDTKSLVLYQLRVPNM